jgi:uncharacterized membrane protein
MSEIAITMPDESTRPVRVMGLPLSTVSWIVMFLATLDAWITDHLVSREFGREVNPIMEWAHTTGGTVLFVFGKCALTAACLWWMNKRAPPREGRLAAIIALAIYVPVTVLHIITTSTIPT